MPTPTYTPLANLTLGSSAASVTFSSINQGFRDLVLVVTGITSIDDFNNAYLTFNSDTGTNYSTVQMRGDGSSTSSVSSSSTNRGWIAQNPTFILGATTTALVSIMDYSATDKHKSWLARTDRAGGSTTALAGRWASTSAITSVQIKIDSLNFGSGSTFALYGIAA